MKIKDLKKELEKVIECQEQYAACLDKNNPSASRNQSCCEDMAEMARAILAACNGDRVSLRMYQ